MTPRFEWTWGGPNLRASSAIRLYCNQRCVCTKDDTGPGNIVNGTTSLPVNAHWKLQIDPVIESIELMRQKALALHADALMITGGAELDGGFDQAAKNYDSIQILPPQNSTNPQAGTCGSDGKQFCPVQWNMTLLGPIPVVRRTPNTHEASSDGYTFAGENSERRTRANPLIV